MLNEPERVWVYLIQLEADKTAYFDPYLEFSSIYPRGFREMHDQWLINE